MAERVGAAFERLVTTAARNPGLTSALLLAATPPDPAVSGALPAWSSPVNRYLQTLVGEEEVPELEAITMVLGYVFFSALIAMALRGQDPAVAVAALRTAARLLLPVTPDPSAR